MQPRGKAGKSRLVDFLPRPYPGFAERRAILAAKHRTGGPMQPLTAYGATLLCFAIVDTLWLGVVARDYYRQALGSLLAPKVNFWAAVAFYLVYSLGIVIFAVLPALRSDSVATALVHGALFGFFCYATYDLTNMATLRAWPIGMSLVDMAWGTLLTAAAALVGTLAARAVG